MSKSTVSFDWLTILLYLLMVLFGWVNIYSASLGDNPSSFFDFNEVYGKQAVWILLSFLLITIVLAIDSRFYQRFAVLYISLPYYRLPACLFLARPSQGKQHGMYSAGCRFNLQNL